MKKIDLITGFLGSGKTTFLKEYVKYLISIGENVCILENDFGAVNVDMMLLNDLRGDNCEIEMVAGGCDADCHKRRFKTKLIAMGMDDYTRIVIEPSGIFDVDELFDCLYEEPLSRWYEIGSVISIVDAKVDKALSESARAVLASEAACAGKIVLSKTQCCDAEDILQTKEYIQKSLNSIGCERDISGDFIEKNWANFTNADLESIINAGYQKACYTKRLSDYEAFNTLCFLDERFSKDELVSLSEQIMQDSAYGNIIRVKGFCLEDGTWTEINADKTNIKVSSISDGQDVIIIIGEDIREEKIRELLKKLRKPSRI